MTIDLNRLKTMKREELLTIAMQVGATFHHANKPDTLIENIINKVMLNQFDKPKQEVVAQAPVEAVFATEGELEGALAALKAKYVAFSTTYDHEAKCVVLRYNDGRYRHAETISLSCPVTKIVRKAAEVAKGPLLMRSLKADEWSHLGGNQGKNAYTESVIAG